MVATQDYYSDNLMDKIKTEVAYKDFSKDKEIFEFSN